MIEKLMGMITAFKLLAELRRSFSREKKGGLHLIFLISHKRSKQNVTERMATKLKNILFSLFSRYLLQSIYHFKVFLN